MASDRDRHQSEWTFVVKNMMEYLRIQNNKLRARIDSLIYFSVILVVIAFVIGFILGVKIYGK